MCIVHVCPCAAIVVSEREMVPHKILSKDQAELLCSYTYSTNEAHSQAEVQARGISYMWPAVCGRKTSKMSNEGKCYVAVAQSHSEQVSCFTLQVLHECMICSSFSLMLSLAVPILALILEGHTQHCRSSDQQEVIVPPLRIDPTILGRQSAVLPHIRARPWCMGAAVPPLVAAFGVLLQYASSWLSRPGTEPWASGMPTNNAYPLCPHQTAWDNLFGMASTHTACPVFSLVQYHDSDVGMPDMLLLHLLLELLNVNLLSACS